MGEPMLSVNEQIERLKEKGVTFNLFSEHDAAEYLRSNNYYFKLSAYRRNYDKREGGPLSGQYINLDFAYLRDLAIIDMTLRYTLVQLSLDIEHYVKLDLLRRAEGHREDGRKLFEDFVASLDSGQAKRLYAEMERNASSVYCKDLYEKYRDFIPVYVFLEMVSFGWLVSFYAFCADRYDSDEMQDLRYLLIPCKSIRNAAAHSSCILNDLRPGTASHPVRRPVLNGLGLVGVSASTIKKKLRNDRIRQIVSLLYVYKRVVTSVGMNDKAAVLLRNLVDRMEKHAEFYENNDMINSSFSFLSVAISKWFPEQKNRGQASRPRPYKK